MTTNGGPLWGECCWTRHEDWTVDDPAGQDVATVKRIVAHMDAPASAPRSLS